MSFEELGLCALLAGAVYLGVDAGPVHAQGHAGSAAASRITVQQAEVAVEKAAAERNIPISAEVRAALAVEVVQQEAARSTNGGTVGNVDRGAQRIVAPIAAKRAGHATAAEAKKILAAATKNDVTRTLTAEVRQYFAKRGRNLNGEAQQLLVADLQKQTDALAQSGLSAEVIRSRNADFLTRLNTRLRSTSIVTAEEYRAAYELFPKIVHVDIDSEPTDATVRFGVGPLHATPIKAKPFEAGRSYLFNFSKRGYHPDSRVFYVAPLDGQSVLGVLRPTKPNGSANEQESGGAPDAGPQLPQPPTEDEPPPATVPERHFPWFYIFLIGVGIIVGVFLLVGRKA